MNNSFKNGFWGVIGMAAGLWVVGAISKLTEKPEKPEEGEKDKAEAWEDSVK